MIRTTSNSKADTSGTWWSVSVGESLIVSFLSPKGVFKGRSKIERIMKTSTAPFFGLKQTKHYTCETEVSNAICAFGRWHLGMMDTFATT